MSSLYLSTDFDRPAVRLELPTGLSDGSHPALGLTDGFVRGTRIVGRFSKPSAALGLRVQPTGQPILVSIQLHHDRESIQWRLDRVDGAAVSGPSRPRLIGIRANGNVTRAVLLDLSGKDGQGGPKKHAIGWSSLELDPAQVRSDGFVLIEITDGYEWAPAWARDRLESHAPVGIRVDAIRLTSGPAAGIAEAFGPRSDERRGLASTGGLPSKTANSRRVLHNGLFVINPQTNVSAVLDRELKILLAPELANSMVPQRSRSADIPRKRDRTVHFFEHSGTAAAGLNLTSEQFRRKAVKKLLVHTADIQPVHSIRSKRPRRVARLSKAREYLQGLVPHRVRWGLKSKLGRFLARRVRISAKGASLGGQEEVDVVLSTLSNGSTSLSIAESENPVLVDVWLVRRRGADRSVRWPLRVALGGCRVRDR